MKIVLISPYEIGRQPFALAQPAAWLKSDGFEVECMDLAVEPFDLTRLRDADIVAVHLAMHAGARLAAEIIPRIAEINSIQAICVYGLYAPVNDEYFRSLGANYVLGGEFESNLLTICRNIQSGTVLNSLRETRTSMEKLEFVKPDRSGLPSLTNYARLQLPDGSEKSVGFVEASRGCKHVCRHCPVVPVYEGRFRIVSLNVIMEDIRQQIADGAQHISFGDPDFLNGPGHASRIIERLHSEFPQITWDATIKIEHLLKHSRLLESFARSGCLFITSAVESIEDKVLERLEKGHTASDFKKALELMRGLGISMLPTFVPFTPWTTLQGYRRLLETITELNLINSIAPVQLSIRLLLPQGSRLLESADRHSWLGEFDAKMLGYPWSHPDPRVDDLQRQIQSYAMKAENLNLGRHKSFTGIWKLAHEALELPAPELPAETADLTPCLSEPWYCCAEPTENQRILITEIPDVACVQEAIPANSPMA